MQEIKNFELLLLFIAVTVVLQIVNLYCHCLVYDRDTFISKIYYMAITPNLVHANWMHWFLNIINLVAIFLIYDRVWSAKKFLIFFILASWFVVCCLYLFSIEVTNYVGLSGVLYGIAVYSALHGFKEQKFISVLILSFVISKLLFYDFINKITFTTELLSDLNVVTDVHLYGALFGFLIFWGERLLGDEIYH